MVPPAKLPLVTLLSMAALLSTIAVSPTMALPSAPVRSKVMPTYRDVPDHPRQVADAQAARPKTASVRRQGNWLTLKPINPAAAQPVTLWATYYHVYQAQPVAGGVPLIDPDGNRLRHALSQRDWCQQFSVWQFSWYWAECLALDLPA